MRKQRTHQDFLSYHQGLAKAWNVFYSTRLFVKFQSKSTEVKFD